MCMARMKMYGTYENVWHVLNLTTCVEGGGANISIRDHPGSSGMRPGVRDVSGIHKGRGKGGKNNPGDKYVPSVILFVLLGLGGHLYFWTGQAKGGGKNHSLNCGPTSVLKRCGPHPHRFQSDAGHTRIASRRFRRHPGLWKNTGADINPY